MYIRSDALSGRLGTARQFFRTFDLHPVLTAKSSARLMVRNQMFNFSLFLSKRVGSKSAFIKEHSDTCFGS